MVRPLDYRKLKLAIPDSLPPIRTRMRDYLAASAMTACLALSWIAYVIPLLDHSQPFIPFWSQTLPAVEPGAAPLAHGLAVMMALVAGGLGVISGGLRPMGLVGRLGLAVIFGSAIVWSLIAYDSTELLSGPLLGPTGPFVWFVSAFVLAGTNDRVWVVQDRLMVILAYVTAVLAVRELLTVQPLLAQDSSRLAGYTLALIWLAGWTLLTGMLDGGFKLILRLIPFSILVVCAIHGRARGWTVISLALFGLFIYRRAGTQGNPAPRVRLVLAAGVLVVLGVLAVYAAAPNSVFQGLEMITAQVNGVVERGHYAHFFSSVVPSTFLLGGGPKATWHLRGAGDFQFFGNGILWTAFIGGLPILIGYYVVVLRPALRLVGRGLLGRDYAAMVMVTTWAVAMTGIGGPTLPGTFFINYVVLLWAGRCHVLRTAYAAAKAARKMEAQGLRATNIPHVAS